MITQNSFGTFNPQNKLFANANIKFIDVSLGIEYTQTYSPNGRNWIKTATDKYPDISYLGGYVGSPVVSVTGLNTDNSNPQSPIVKISVDGTTITGQGTPADPLVATSSGGATDLGIANITSTSLDITSSTGSDATIPQATTTDAGLLNAADKIKINALDSAAYRPTSDFDAAGSATTAQSNAENYADGIVATEATARANGDSSTLSSAETYADGKVSDTAYNATSWDGVTTIAPSKNAVRDKIESIETEISGKADAASPTFTGTLTTPAIIVSSETASTIASFDGSKNIKSLATATYPSLTELSYVKGLTSAVQSQIDSKQASGSYAVTTNNLSDLSNAATARTNLIAESAITMYGSSVSLAASTPYYFGMFYDTAPITTAQRLQYQMPFARVLVGATWSIRITGTLASAGSITLKVIINNTTLVTLTSSQAATAVFQSGKVTGLTQALAADDLVEIQMTTPAWSTTPTGFRISCTLILE